MNFMACPRELLGGSKAGRSRADNRNALARLALRRLGHDPAFLEGPVSDGAFDRLYGDWLVVDVKRTGRLTRRRANAASDLREVVGRVQIERRGFPVSPINEVVPIGDLIIHRTAVVAVGDAAIHAPRRLSAHLVLWQRHYELAPVLHARLDGFIAAVDAFEFHEASDLAHCRKLLCWRRSACCQIQLTLDIHFDRCISGSVRCRSRDGETVWRSGCLPNSSRNSG